MLSIGKFAEKMGVSVRTVQRYIAEGKMAPTTRTPGGHMRFSLDTARKEFDSICLDRRGRPRGSSGAAIWRNLGSDMEPAFRRASLYGGVIYTR